MFRDRMNIKRWKTHYAKMNQKKADLTNVAL